MESVNALFVGGPVGGMYRTLPSPAPGVYYYPIYGENGMPVEGKYIKRTYPTTKGEAKFYVHESIHPDTAEAHIIMALLEVK